MTTAGRALRIISVTARLPHGAGEPFLIPELAELKRQGCTVTIVPVRPRGEAVHAGGAALVPNTVSLPLLTGEIVRAGLGEIARSPGTVLRALVSLRGSRNPHILLKNLAVFPKALWLARYAREAGVDHLHAHWASTPATLAMLASRIASVSWSFTAHRWDIAENNLLRLKVRDACFARAISAHGARELAGIVGEPSRPPWLLYVGVDLTAESATEPTGSPFRVLTAARFVEKKGHADLIAAVERLKGRGVAIRAELAGDGPLAAQLRARVRDAGLEGDVTFLGGVPHEELIARLAAGRWHAAVLPSIVTQSGELEGIPVALMEAMAHGVPVIATATGGIPELLQDGAGVIVPPADPDALADAVARLAGDPALRKTIGEQGRRRVEESFSAVETAAALRARFEECARA